MLEKENVVVHRKIVRLILKCTNTVYIMKPSPAVFSVRCRPKENILTVLYIVAEVNILVQSFLLLCLITICSISCIFYHPFLDT